jgi:uroporphyrinogen-III synthase
MTGVRVLIPSAAVTRDVVAAELRKRGAEVRVVEAYRNVVPPDTASRAKLLLSAPYPDWITFTSSSALENLIQITGAEPLRHVKIATIGPIASETVRHHALEVAIEAAVHSIPGMVAALCQHERG